MPKVKLTLFEDPIDVPDDEVEVLRAQGLLEEKTTAESASRSAAAKATPKKDGDQP